MTLQRRLLTSKQNVIDIISDDNLAENHFSNPSNYADIVLNQINQDRFYDEIFDGEDDLTILDIGGNIGLFSLYAQDRAKAIYPVEPTPNHFHILKELTKDYPNIHPLNYAAGNKMEVIDFFINEENTTMNSLANKYGKKVEVQAKTIRDIIDELGLDHVDFVKCDIEGSEMVALTDETVAAVKDIVDVWFIEVHSTAPADAVGDPAVIWHTSLNQNRKQLSDIFTRNGYTVSDYRHDGLYIYKE